MLFTIYCKTESRCSLIVCCHTGWRRVPITLTPPRSYLAVMRVPVTYDQAVEVEKLEIAVLPGTGQVRSDGLDTHACGYMKEADEE